jgi:uncharacterized protein (DUF433 family)
MKDLKQFITVDKEIASGTPVFKGTRIAVKTLFDYLEDGSLEEFLKGFPSVTKQQAEAALELAAEKFLADITE